MFFAGCSFTSMIRYGDPWVSISSSHRFKASKRTQQNRTSICLNETYIDCYCWWKKACTRWYGKYLIIHWGFLHPRWFSVDFFHQQYVTWWKNAVSKGGFSPQGIFRREATRLADDLWKLLIIWNIDILLMECWGKKSGDHHLGCIKPVQQILG